MSTPATKVFGMNLGIDPKLIVLALIVFAGVLYYFTSGSGTEGSGGGVPAITTLPSRPGGRPDAPRRSRTSRNDRGILRLVPVDGSHGDVDPTLRLRLLERLQSVPPAAGLRNLFEAGGPATEALPEIPKNVPRMMPQARGPESAVQSAPPPPPFVIPLKYYGFVKPAAHSLDGNRGFFMDGDNVLVGGEGDVLEKRFLIVALTPNSARLEDVQAKQGQDLQVTPEAPPAQ